MNDAFGSDESSLRLVLGDDEPPPVRIHNEAGRSPFLLIGDHAGKLIPRSLGNLGVKGDDLVRHIAWDIGVAELGLRLSDSLDSVFIHQPYSRLVVDCNRSPSSTAAIVEVSDGTPVPGNRSLGADEAARRFTEIHAPYHAAIAAELERRAETRAPTILVSLHSFTPAMNGKARPWQIGVLHDAGNVQFARLTLAALEANRDLRVGDNEPYQMDGTDYTIPFHAYPRGLPYVELEIRQDLIAADEGVEQYCAIVRAALECALAKSGRQAPDLT